VTGEIIRLGDGIENFTGTSFNDTILIKAASFPRTLNGASQAAGQPGDALVITGEAELDRVVPAELTRQYLQLWPGARTATLPRTGHLGLISRPTEFARLVVPFVEETTGMTGSRRRIG